MAAALDKIFSEISGYSKAMGTLHNDYLQLVRTDIENFLEKTSTLYGQMQWQGWSTVALTMFSGSFAILGAMIPKGGDAAAPLTDSRLAANDGIQDGLSKALNFLGDRLKDNEFLRTTCKTAGKTFQGLTGASDVWWRSQTTETETKRELFRTNFQEEQQEKRTFSQATTEAQQYALSILQSKSKGN